MSTNNKASYSNGYQEELLRYETIEYMTKALFMLEHVDLCLVTEIAPNPSAYLNVDGALRTCTSKYILRVALEERISDR